MQNYVEGCFPGMSQEGEGSAPAAREAPLLAFFANCSRLSMSLHKAPIFHWPPSRKASKKASGGRDLGRALSLPAQTFRNTASLKE